MLFACCSCVEPAQAVPTADSRAHLPPKSNLKSLEDAADRLRSDPEGLDDTAGRLRSDPEGLEDTVGRLRLNPENV